MKPFNLNLAKQGHPLITRDGRKIVQFVHFTEPFDQKSNSVLYVLTEKGEKFCNCIDGEYYHNEVNNDDLFLDDSVPWNPLLKEGDLVEVRDFEEKKWQKRIFLYFNKYKKIMCVNNRDKASYLEGKCYEVLPWNQYRLITQEPIIEIIVRIDGKEAKLSDIPDETLKKIKEKELK